MLSPLEGLIIKQDITDIAASEELILNDEDRISVLESMGSIDVQACPGSGKTTLIAAKLILLAKKWPFQHQGICVLSHTNVAKDEIIGRLERSKTIEAQRLLSYPHFIGTIQEFVNRFLAMPYLRSRGVQNITVDNNEYVKVARKLLDNGQFAWLRGTLNGLGTPENLDAFLRDTFRLSTNNGADININKKPKAWKKQENLQKAQAALVQLKQYLDERGFYLFRDMYTHAQTVFSENASLGMSVSVRFPYVFLDEMQDTQKFQDDLLLQIFPLTEPGLTVQRYGDPDQAIFHGVGGEDPNSSYNGKSFEDMDFVINKSHRFDDEIGKKIRGVSFNTVYLETELSENILEERAQIHADGQSFEHTIIIYHDETRANVIPEFTDIVSCQFSEAYKGSDKFIIKVIGAVGNEIDPDKQELKIGHYWTGYDKSKAKNKFTESTFIEAVHYCRQSPSVDWAANYKWLTDCVLKLLRRADKKDEEGRYFSATSMRELLKATDKWVNYRELIYMMLCDDYQIDQEFWCDASRALSAIFDFNNLSAEAFEYMTYQDEGGFAGTAHDIDEPEEGALTTLPENMIRHLDGFRVELSTIHGVKGETHDATLVLETKYHCFDLKEILPYLAGDLPNQEHPNVKLRDNPHHSAAFKPNKKFMRQLYVAMSRPKHLLCLALHANHITHEQRTSLEAAGWRLRDLALDG